MSVDGEILGKLCRLSMGHYHIKRTIKYLKKPNYTDTITILENIKSNIASNYSEIFSELNIEQQREIIKLGHYPKGDFLCTE